MTAHSKIPTNITDTRLLRSMEKRRNILARTVSRVFQNQSKPLANTASSQNGNIGQEQSSTSTPVINPKHDIPCDDPLEYCTDVSKKPKGLIRWAKLLPGRIKRYYWILFPKPTAEELEDLRLENIEKEKDKIAITEMRVFMGKSARKLGQLGMRDLLNSPDPNKPKKLKLVRFSAMARDVLNNKLVMRLDTEPSHLPTYVQVSKLGRDDVYSDEMLPTLGKYSQWDSQNYGVTLTVFRHGLEGLPEHVSIEELWKKMPDNKPPYTVAIGFGDNSSTHFIDPSEYPHLLVSGTTGWGKSNMLNNILCLWLNRGLTPEQIQFVLFDLKKGMEFSSYENLPHLYKDEEIKTGIIEDLEGVLPALHRMQVVRDQRMDIIKKNGCKSFQEYNLDVPPSKRLPAIFLFFDEWAKIRLSRSGSGPKALAREVIELANKAIMNIFKDRAQDDRGMLFDALVEFGKAVLKLRTAKHFGLEAEEMLAEFTNLARAAGMFVVLATQHPSKEVLSGLIMINFPTRIVLKSSVGGSLAALGTRSAFSLEHKGRAILLDRGIETKIQTPEIKPENIKFIVHKAITGESLGNINGISLDYILKYALENLGGALDGLELYKTFKEQNVRYRWILQALREAEGKEFVISGTKYKVNHKGKNAPRQLIRVKE
jgi:hypothetical protein